MADNSIDETPDRRKTDPRFEALTQSVDQFTVEVKMLRHEVRIVEESGKRDRRIMALLAIITAVLLPLTVLSAAGTFATYNVGQVIQDCTTPDGQCNNRLNNATLASSAAIGYRSERERIITELQVAAATGDTASVAALQKRLDDVDQLLAEALAARAQARDLSAPEPTLPPTTILP